MFTRTKPGLVYKERTKRLGAGKRGVPYTLITDNTAAYLMQQGKVDMIMVGVDRISANGDTAAKIGVYGLAVLAHYHRIPFYTVSPRSTIDMKIATWADIPVEQRYPTKCGSSTAPQSRCPMRMF